MEETVRVPIERIDTATGQVTAVGTAEMRGVTLDHYETISGAELKLRPGEMFAIVTTVRGDDS